MLNGVTQAVSSGYWARRVVEGGAKWKGNSLAKAANYGTGIGQARTMMSILKKAHLGEVTVSVWPKILKEICAKKNIFVLE